MVLQNKNLFIFLTQKLRHFWNKFYFQISLSTLDIFYLIIARKKLLKACLFLNKKIAKKKIIKQMDTLLIINKKYLKKYI